MPAHRLPTIQQLFLQLWQTREKLPAILYAPDSGNPDLHAYLSFEKENGKTYVVSTMNLTPELPVYPNGTRRLLIRRHQAGNCVIYETDGFMNWPYGLWN